MPGLNAVCGPEGTVRELVPLFDRAQEKMLHLPHYSRQRVLTGTNILAGTTAYGSYPINIYDSDRVFILLEGMIYNLSPDTVRKALPGIATDLFDVGSTEFVRKLMSEADGEFAVLMYDKQRHSLAVFNDAWGRLPLYFHHDGERLIVSREIKFITAFLDKIVFGRQALWEYLLFGCPLGEKTLVEGITRLPPATLITAAGVPQTVRQQTLVPVDFSKNIDTAKKPEDQVRDLRELFLSGLRTRVETLEGKKPVILLSGGLDSRATLAGLALIGRKPAGATLRYQNPGEDRYVMELSREFGIETEVIEPGTIGLEEYRRLVRLKDGLNPTSVAQQLPFMERILARHGQDTAIFTGLYGGETFRYLNITAGLKTEWRLAEFLMNTPDKYRYSVENTCAILSVSREEIARRLLKCVSDYPEEDIYKKYLHFKFEIDYRWAGEGEDRMRFYAWETTPFYARKFRKYALSIDERRKNTLFFRNLLYSIDPRTCSVRYYNDGSSMNNVLRLQLLGIAENAVRHPVVRRYAMAAADALQRMRRAGKKSSDPGQAVLRDLLPGMAEHPVISGYLSPEACKSVTASEPSTNMLHRMLTLFLYMAEATGPAFIEAPAETPGVTVSTGGVRTTP